MQINDITLPIADIATVSFGLAAGRLIESAFPAIVSKIHGVLKFLFLLFVAGASLTTFAFAKGYIPHLAELSNLLDTKVTTAASTVVPDLAPSPSFSCNDVQLPGEKFTCSDNELAAADREMSETYFSVRASAKDKSVKQKLLLTQRQFNARLSVAPLDKQTYLQMYHSRIAEIKTIGIGAPATSERMTNASSASTLGPADSSSPGAISDSAE